MIDRPEANCRKLPQLPPANGSRAGDHHFPFLFMLTSSHKRRCTYDAQLASGPRRYSACTFCTLQFPTSFDEKTMRPVPDIRLSARQPLLRDKSRHPRSDVIDTDTDTSLYPFSFSPVFLFLEYRRVNSHLNLVPQDHRSRTTRTSAPLNGHRTSTRLLVRLVEHSVHGRKAHRLLYFLESGRSISTSPRSISNHTELGLIVFPIPQTIPYGVSLTQATAGLFLVFTIGGACNAGRAFLMRMSGAS
jgi:hypothetical protein